MSGAREQAEAIADGLTSANPEHTLINSVLVPIVRAGIELGNGQPSHAVEHLAVVAPYELGFIAALIPVDLVAFLYFMSGLGHQRLEVFRTHSPDDPGPDPSAISRGRAAGSGARPSTGRPIAASVDAYERFLNGWRGADADVPALWAAREQCRRLTSRRTRPSNRPSPKIAKRPTRSRS